MNPLKQYKKLQALNVLAEQCLTREEAQKVIRKACLLYTSPSPRD